MAQVNMPNVGQKDDALTTLMKGLTIASQVYGIRTNMAQLDKMQKDQQIADENRATAQADKERYAQGKFNKGELLDIGKNYDISSSPQSPDAIKIASVDSPDSPLYASILKTKPKAEYKEVSFVDDKGIKHTKFVNPESAGEIISYEDKINNDNKLNNKQPNKEQFDAALFGKRMETSNDVLNKLASSGYDRSSYLSGLSSTVLPESMQSSLLKQQNQAERNFVNAVLRRESGAAISKEEFANAALQYFPRAGDTPEVLAQKEQNRQQAIEGMKAASGNAWALVPSVGIKAPNKQNTDGQAFAGEKKGPSPLDLLRVKAQNGDKKAQEYLNSLNKGQ